MKKTIIILSALLACMSMSAEVLSPAQALQRVVGTAPAQMRKAAARAAVDATPARVVKNYNANPELYMFTPAEGGVLLVSAESEAPALLGYTESTLTDGTIPPALEYMMNCYAEEINAMRQGNIIYGESRADEEDFAPLDIVCPTTWNQGRPYYDACPNRPVDQWGNDHYATGCVATAMAQVLYTHKYPQQCSGGVHTFLWSEAGEDLSIDFDTVKLDWDNMLPNYPEDGSGATQIQKDAVAQLMKAVGFSANMNYTPGGSGTHGFLMAAGLVKYFDYDITTRVYQRRWISMPQWKKMIYDELADGHAVYMDAQTGFEAPSAHAFMIDGYRGNGFFHVNWGWGGLSDGYFLLTTMAPGAQGIGGAAVPSGYCASQGIILGLKHGRTGDIEDVEPQFFLSGKLKPNVTSTKLGTEVTFSGSEFYNIGAVTHANGVAPGIKFTHEDGSVFWVHENVEMNVPAASVLGLYSMRLPKVVIPANLPDGNYVVSPAIYSKHHDNHFDTPVCIGQGGTIKATVADGTVTFDAPQLASLKLEAELMSKSLGYNRDNQVNCSITNTSNEDYDGYIYAWLVKRGSTKKRTGLDRFHVNVEPGKTIDVTSKLIFNDNTVGSGNYELLFLDQNNQFISDPIPVEVQGNINAVELTAEGIVCVSNAQDDLQFDVTLTATEGDYYNFLYLQIRSGKTELATFQLKKTSISYETTETVRFSGKFPEGTVGKKYTAYICYRNTQGIDEAEGKERYLTFQLSDVNTINSAIGQVSATSKNTNTEYYDLSGRRVDNPVKGIYLMRVGGETTKVKL